MSLSTMDMFDAFGMGGYIDTIDKVYICPRWFARQCPENDNGLSDIDYERIANNPSRYIRTPMFNLYGVDCIAALKAGIPMEELEKLGVTKEEIGNVFMNNSNCENPPASNEKERSVLDGIYGLFPSNQSLHTYWRLRYNLYLMYIKEWAIAHHINFE